MGYGAAFGAALGVWALALKNEKGGITMNTLIRRGTVVGLALLMVLALIAAPLVAIADQEGQAGTTLSAYKTATGYWTRTYTWTISKSVSPDSWEFYPGDSGTSWYTVKVTKDAGTDAWWVEGQICVTNGGAVATENLKLVDRVQYKTGAGQFQDLPGATWTLSPEQQLGPGESKCYTYKIIFTPVSGATYRNVVKVTITNHSGHLGEEWGPEPKAGFSLPGTPTLINDTIHVDDTNGSSWTFSASGEVTYDKTFTCANAGTHTNTATIRETGQSDSATVTVRCIYAQPPSGCTRTIGYWKNHTSEWPSGQSPSDPFFSSGKTWFQVAWTQPAEGNAYYILAHQYIAARLNILNGAASTSEVNGALVWATDFFNTYTPTSSLSEQVRALAISYAGILDSYNNGSIGPGHCE